MRYRRFAEVSEDRYISLRFTISKDDNDNDDGDDDDDEEEEEEISKMRLMQSRLKWPPLLVWI